MTAKLTRRTLGRDALASAAATAALAGAATPARADTPRDRVASILPDLVAKLHDGMGQWHVPGIAIGVVVGDETVLARGLGVRTAGTMDRVDVDTIFQIGSTTKAFAATTEAILVDQHKLRWMDRVIDHDAGFRMSDPWVTREFRIIDLLAQRSGLRPYVLDTMWVLGYSADQLIAALRTARAVSSFRTTFAYQNVLHSVAGNIVAGLVGVPRWQDALSRLILEPLGMSSTTSSAAGMLAAADRATGHTFYGGQLVQQPLIDGFPYNAGPAGCMNSCVSDMVQWLRLLIGRGEIAGRRLVSAHALETTWKPRVESRPEDGYPFVWGAYANGWVTRQTERGTVVWHNGGTQQFRAHVGIVPAAGVGIVILSNESTNDLVDTAALWFYDRVLGNTPEDYDAIGLARSKAAADKQAALDRRPEAIGSPRPSGDYAGAYRSDAAGLAQVGPADDGALSLHLETPGASFRLESWGDDVFAIVPVDPANAAVLKPSSPLLVQFHRTVHGAVDTMGFDGEPDLVFNRADP